ncbi:MAG: polysaccharide export protein, partial [Clostridia bacterium]|nr:polysaccharide export protein [Clostridia bacterium]
MNTQHDEIEIDIFEILFVIKKRLWIIILTAVILAGTAGAISYYLINPMYSSTSKLYI